tara:strand:+ start:66296 stop:66607 length:312 start_codon:yes stop_codon:yes gene_type:complete
MSINKEDLKYMIDSHITIDEELVDERKGVPQSRYVIEVKEGSAYFDIGTENMEEVPSHVVGLWMMDYSMDLRYESSRDLLKDGFTDWVRCKPVEVVVSSWEEI